MSAQASTVFTFTLEILIIFASSIILLNTIVIAEETRNTTINNINNNNYLPKLFNQIQQSVIQISSSDDEDISKQLGSRLGSGFVYDKNGHIITNKHVVSANGELIVTFSDGSIYDGKIIASDPYSDLAVVKVNTVPQEKLIPLTIGNSSKLIVGQQVAAVGNPFGLSGSMTEGIISGLGRLLPSSPPQAEPLFGRDSITIMGAFSKPQYFSN